MAQQVVVAGGGYAGLAALGELLNQSGTRLTLIDAESGQTLIPELPEALTPGESVARRVLSYQHLLKDARVHRIIDTIVGLNAGSRSLMLDSGEQVGFDWLVLAVGTTPAFPGVPGLEAHALPVKSAIDAERIKRELGQGKDQSVVVIGGGLTGVEIAGTLVASHRVCLVEASPRLLPGLGPGLASYARRQLESAGMKFYLGESVSEVSKTQVHAGRYDLAYDVLIWAGGIAPPKWLEATDLRLDDAGYPLADASGEVAAQVYVAGDLWRIPGHGGQWVPQTAQLAEQAGTYVGRVIGRRIRQETPLPPFHAHLRGMLVALTPGKGVGWVYRGGIGVQGYSARWLKGLAFRQYRRGLAKSFDHIRLG